MALRITTFVSQACLQATFGKHQNVHGSWINKFGACVWLWVIFKVKHNLKKDQDKFAFSKWNLVLNNSQAVETERRRRKYCFEAENFSFFFHLLIINFLTRSWWLNHHAPRVTQYPNEKCSAQKCKFKEIRRTTDELSTVTRITFLFCIILSLRKKGETWEYNISESHFSKALYNVFFNFAKSLGSLSRHFSELEKFVNGIVVFSANEQRNNRPIRSN